MKYCLLLSIIVLFFSNIEAEESGALFCINRVNSDYHINLIALTEKDSLIVPNFATPEELEKFVEQYFAKDKQFELFYRGRKVGYFVVEKWERGETSAKGRVNVLDSLNLYDKFIGASIGLFKSTMTEKPAFETKNEEEIIKIEGMHILIKHGIEEGFAEKLKVQRWGTVDLHNDSKLYIFATVDLSGEDGERFCSEFFLLEAKKENYTNTLTLINCGEPKGLEIWYFLDKLDMDNDGKDEIILKFYDWEGEGYEIYKKIKNKWERIFKGWGGGCGP